jgi:VanZ family protein
MLSLKSTHLRSILFRYLPLLFTLGVIFLNSTSHNPYKHIPASISQPVDAAGSSVSQALTGHAAAEEEIFGQPGHVIEYFLLGLAAAHTLFWKRKIALPAASALFAACAFYALTDEVHQIFVPGRAFEIPDLILDCAGILLGLLIYNGIREIQQKRLKPQ